MKLPAVLLIGSLVLNAILLATAGRWAGPAAGSRAATTAPSAATTAPKSRPGSAAAAGRSGSATNNEARAGWAALDTDDLPELARRLRAAGFAPQVIRAIIGAKIDAIFAPRIQALVEPDLNTPAWKAETNGSLNRKAIEDRSQIARERSRMLREILGSDAMAGDDNADFARRRQYGDLPANKIDLIQRINDDYAEMASQIRASMRGISLPDDREKLALLEREKRADLAAIMTPQELEEYDIRTSSAAAVLRSTMAVMDATEDEFRTIFRLQAQYNDRLNFNSFGAAIRITQDMMTDRQAAEKELMQKIQAALPPDRFTEYARAQDRDYQTLYHLTQQQNLSKETAIQAYGLREYYAAESGKIVDDRNLTLPQRREQLQGLARDATVKLSGILGAQAATTYSQGSNWVQTLERGAAFNLGPGGFLEVRNPAPPPPAPKKG